MRGRGVAGSLFLAVLVAGCAGSTGTTASSPSPTRESPSQAPSVTADASDSPSSEPSPTPSVSTTPTREPLGPSRARIRVTGDIQTSFNLPLAGTDGFSVTWCDTPRDCASAANSLQLSGDDLGVLGSHRTNRAGLDVLLEIQDRFLYVSYSDIEQGECTVAFTVADERGFQGRIVCPDVSNGFGIGALTVSASGTFTAATD